MKSSSVEQVQRVRHLLLRELEEHQTPMSLQQLEFELGGEKLSHRSLKEAAWQLVEEGKIEFNATWDLELVQLL